MSFGTSAKVTGAKDVLKALKDLDPELRKETQAEMRRAVAPMQAAARDYVPSKPPLSGWRATGRLAWTNKARTGIKTRIGGRYSKTANSWPLVTLIQSDPAGSVFDIAGRSSSGRDPRGQNLIAVLNARYGRASRSMWRAAEKTLPEVQDAVIAAVDAASQTIERRAE